jgi:hypothetical protein
MAWPSTRPGGGCCPSISAGSLAAGQVIGVPADGPHGLWLDGQRLFCAADANTLVILHRDTGAALGTVPLPGAPDVVMHDAGLCHLYIAVGEPGAVCVVDNGRLQLLETVPTEHGAHTLGIDPQRHAVFVFLPASGGAAVYLDR